MGGGQGSGRKLQIDSVRDGRTNTDGEEMKGDEKMDGGVKLEKTADAGNQLGQQNKILLVILIVTVSITMGAGLPQLSVKQQ